MKLLDKKISLLFLLFASFFDTQAQDLVHKIGDNPTLINSSAALEIESTTKGVLISRLDSQQRDAISSPANGLLIYNISNNTFEVFKNTCSCWVTITDGGITPASNLVNTAPWASNITVSGLLIVGNTLTANYVYNDTHGDPEAATSFQWQTAPLNTGVGMTNISSATSSTYTLAPGDAGKFVRVRITPRASSGVLNGIDYFSAWFWIDAANTPTATNLNVTGTVAAGNMLTASYTFQGGSGVENTAVDGSGTLFIWQTASSSVGAGTSTAPLNNDLIHLKDYISTNALIGRFIRVGVLAKDNAGLAGSNYVFSPWVGPITPSLEEAPVASNVTYSPSPASGLLLTGSYTYFDANYDPEGTCLYKWYRADDASGLNQVAIAGATSSTYTCTPLDDGKFIGFSVTPVALTGTSTGVESVYYDVNASLPKAVFTFTGSEPKYLPFFSKNRSMDSFNTLSVEIDVTQVGGIVFSTNTVDGYSFNASTTFATLGVQWVTIPATGLKLNYNSGGDTFTLTGDGASTITRSISIKNTALGSDITTLSNGTEFFSNNGSCASRLVSTGYTSGTCSGSISVGGTSYNLVHINGQCWMGRNYNGAPTAPCSDAINTGCNVWLNTSGPNIGAWGYYSTTLSGSAGWGTSELAAGEGLLYQLNAAMSGNIYERSRGVCPEGWHIPSDCEWMYLEHGLGMSLTDQVASGGRVSGSVGSKLSSLTSSGNNSSGFTGLLTGRRLASNGTFFGRGNSSNFWSSTISGSSYIRRQISSSIIGVDRGTSLVTDAHVVRCLRD